jgi:hypothetical protein
MKLMFLLLILSSCFPCSVNAASPARQQKSWTVMIYMNAKNNLEESALRNFDEIAEVGSSKDVDIVVALGRLNEHPDDCQRCNRHPWSGVRFFHLEQGPDPEGGKPVRKLLVGDMGSPRTLEAFVRFSRREFPSRHYALIIWGHGYGFSFLNASRQLGIVTHTGSVADSGESVGEAPHGCTTPNGAEGNLKAVSSDQDFGHLLFNRQIEETLRKILGKGPKLDLLGFDACLMGSVEIAYGMRDVADYLVASEDLIPSCSWTYQGPLHDLVAQAASMDGRGLAHEFVAGYARKFADGPTFATLSAIRLDQLDALSTEISGLAVALQDVPDSELAAISHARNGCRVFGTDDNYHNPVDLDQFLHILKPLLPGDAQVQKAISGVTSILDSNQFVIDRFPAGDQAFGLTIYFPPSIRDFTVNPDNEDNGAYERNDCADAIARHAVEFVCSNSWSLFLPSYLNRTSSEVAASNRILKQENAQ